MQGPLVIAALNRLVNIKSLLSGGDTGGDWMSIENFRKNVLIHSGALFSKKSGGADAKSAGLFSVINSNSAVNTDKNV